MPIAWRASDNVFANCRPPPRARPRELPRQGATPPSGAAFISIHQFPCYPGTGTRNVGNNCYNYPVLPQTLRGEYRHVLASALEHLEAFKPSLVAVSAGFDAYARDPLAQGSLEVED